MHHPDGLKFNIPYPNIHASIDCKIFLGSYRRAGNPADTRAMSLLSKYNREIIQLNL